MALKKFHDAEATTCTAQRQLTCSAVIPRIKASRTLERVRLATTTLGNLPRKTWYETKSIAA